MPPSRRIPFLIYAACSLAIVAGLVWITLAAAALEAREFRARADAALKKAVGTVLWRMDSDLGPVITKQAGWRYFHYRSFYPAQRAYTRMFEEVQEGEVLFPSPLLESPGPFVRLHFQQEPDGTLGSPQVPTGNWRDQAVSGYVSEEVVQIAEARLASLSRLLGSGIHLRETPPPTDDPLDDASAALTIESGAGADAQRLTMQNEYQFRQQSAAMARKSGKGEASGEWIAPALSESPAGQEASGPAPPRQQVAAAEPEAILERSVAESGAGARSAEGRRRDNRVIEPAPRPASGADPNAVDERPLEPLWFTGPESEGPQLIFRREVVVGSQTLVQGIWMDWPLLRIWLLQRAEGLLPGADLEPVYSRAWGEGLDADRLLAGVPAVLIPGDLPAVVMPVVTPARAALAVTWLAVLVAVGTVGFVLRQSMDLAERRGQFVSAVTHELRTPLTTFCLYTQMLADGMVQNDGTRTDYLCTLKDESHRLARIVENVLEFARLGRRTGPTMAIGHSRWASRRGRTVPAAAPAEARSLLDSILTVLDRRAGQSAMTLVAETGAAEGVRIGANPQTIERILLNLVDNACKYAGESTDRRVHVHAAVTRGVLEVTVTDHGPGIPPAERGRIFAPFHRARRDSEGPSPGLGLGLALARGLARELGGDLVLKTDPPGGGAQFVLRLPTA